MRRLLKVSSASAAEAFLPRISCATRVSLRGLMRRLRSTASASVSCRRRGADFLPIALLPLRLLVRGVAVERAGRRELAELMPDHVLGNHHRNELLAVVDAEGQADELRQDGRPSRPDLDDLVAAGRACLLRLLQHEAVDERTFPSRTRHDGVSLLRVTTAHDHAIRLLVVARLVALGAL